MENNNTQELEMTKAQAMEEVRRHLDRFNKHEDGYMGVRMETSWFYQKKFPDKYKPVFEEIRHLGMMHQALHEMVYILIHNHDLIDFEKLKQSNPLGIIDEYI